MIGLEVLDRALGHARFFGGARHGRCDAQYQARIKGRGYQVVTAEHQFLAGVGVGHFLADVGLGQVRDLAHAGQLHGLGDLGRAAVQRAAKDVWEAQDVVDLIRIVGAARGDDAVGPRGLGQFRANLGLGVRQRQDDGRTRHGFHHLLRQHAGGGATQKDVGVVHHVGQGARRGGLREALLGVVKAAGSPVVDHALGIAGKDVLAPHAQTHHHVQTGQRCSARTRHCDLHILDALVHQFQAVEECR